MTHIEKPSVLSTIIQLEILAKPYFPADNFLYDDNLVVQTLINQGHHAIDLLILTWVDF